MPTYQYACTECNDRLEVVQAFSDASLTVCPACGGKLRKVFSSVGIVFKGSGFYRTDSRAGAGSTVAKSESGADSSPSTTPEKSTEKKSETTSTPSKSTSTPAAAAS